MRRILVLATVAVLMAATLGVTAGPASATIHSLSCADRNNGHAAENSSAATQEPPGITGGDHDRQPIHAITDEAPDQSRANENARAKKNPANGGDCAD
jgi:hypothetical protein